GKRPIEVSRVREAVSQAAQASGDLASVSQTLCRFQGPIVVAHGLAIVSRRPKEAQVQEAVDESGQVSGVVCDDDRTVQVPARPLEVSERFEGGSASSVG